MSQRSKRQQPQSLLQRLRHKVWNEPWTKLHAWLSMGGASIGVSLHTLANDDHFRDALSKFDAVPAGVWLALAVIGATTWVSAER